MKRLCMGLLSLSTTLWSDEYLGRWQLAYQSSQHTITGQNFSTSELSVQKGFSTFGNGFGEFALEVRHLINTDVALSSPYTGHQLGYRATSLGVNMVHVRPDGIFFGLGIGYRMDNLNYTYRPTPTSSLSASSTYRTPLVNVFAGYRFSAVTLGLRLEKSLSTDSTSPVNRFSPSRSMGAFVSYTF
ncbi:MAG: hypothetical protein ACKN95_02270 [Holophagaceae bacterium]